MAGGSRHSVRSDSKGNGRNYAEPLGNRAVLYYICPPVTPIYRGVYEFGLTRVAGRVSRARARFLYTRAVRRDVGQGTHNRHGGGEKSLTPGGEQVTIDFPVPLYPETKDRPMNTARIAAARFSDSLTPSTASPDAVDMARAAMRCADIAYSQMSAEQPERAREALRAAIDHARAALAMLDGAQ